MMLLTWDTLLYVLSLVCLLLAAFGVAPRAVNLGWIGMFFFVLAFLSP
jgi:hypothetical protein